MHALSLSPRCKYVASMNRKYTSKFLRSRLVCIDMGRTSRSAPDKFDCNFDVIEERSPVEVNPNAEKDVGNIESIEKSNGTVNSDVKVVDDKKERTNKNKSKFGNSNAAIVAKDKKLSQDNYSDAMKMLSQYRQSSSEQSRNIEDFSVSFTDMSMEQRGIPVMDKSNSQMKAENENVTVTKEGTKVPLFNGPNILATPLSMQTGTSEGQ